MSDARLRNAFVTGKGAYWDVFSINCMDEAGVFNEAEIAAYKEGYIESRKEDKGR